VVGRRPWEVVATLLFRAGTKRASIWLHTVTVPALVHGASIVGWSFDSTTTPPHCAAPFIAHSSYSDRTIRRSSGNMKSEYRLPADPLDEADLQLHLPGACELTGAVSRGWSFNVVATRHYDHRVHHLNPRILTSIPTITPHSADAA
jgi:hypothetical protein